MLGTIPAGPPGSVAQSNPNYEDWRARAQSLQTLMTSGVGNLIGYLGNGWWFAACTRDQQTHWPIFWIGLAAAVTAVLIYFLTAYHGRGTPPTKPAAS